MPARARTSPEAAAAAGAGPQRRCLVTGAVRDTDGLVRFVIDPRGQVVVDVEERLPGRGFWLSAQRDVIDKASTGKVFARAARRSVEVPQGLADTVEERLTRRCLDLIGLACRAGQVIAGYEKVRRSLKAGRGGLLLAAGDAAPGGRSKVRALASDAPVVEVLSAAELGHALGRERAVHVVVAPGRLSEAIQREAARLAGFRALPVAGAGVGQESDQQGLEAGSR